MDENTVFQASVREDLQAGRDVHITGSGLKDGAVRATLVAVYKKKSPR